MAVAIRDVREHELDSVLALNNAAGVTILPLNAARLRQFFEIADYFRVAVVDGSIVGFLIAMRAGAQYDSPNYRWFGERYDEFVYIDRIVLGQAYRGLGLGRVFYCDVTSYAEVRVPVLSCEVLLEPRDDVSVLFHGMFGFHEVGQQVMAGFNVPVSLLVKSLPSFPFVRDTYLNGPDHGLPNLPWLLEREPHATRRARAAGEN
ncbi:GNAT family N-acetyltransferase [Pseudolysobacter antarcticus]|uniref:GNAT family N-acetyltransferase n=1 Tax=Pseudolysobacter antarcticus TaxID=2511995 RepID=A0A411HL27_9GAMM|nr:GNAT family N-acetyltransferase [Pseudolysobacter antarcticus]QBB71225.1 GNAT family N-acetyltransferase [Pseudolysobacter antarcticus]